MLKRGFDIFASFTGILIVFPFLFPFMLIIALESKGGIFYKQWRVGRHGKDFRLLKIRTMVMDSDKKGQLTVGKHDSRVTPTGHFLRKLKLDEFPQLINILRGDMSLVGPRPEVRKYVEMYNEDQMKVLNIRPGLTDLASLEYYDESERLASYPDPEKAYIEIVMPHKLALNLEYIAKRGFFYDLGIIFRTVFEWFK